MKIGLGLSLNSSISNSAMRCNLGLIILINIIDLIFLLKGNKIK